MSIGAINIGSAAASVTPTNTTTNARETHLPSNNQLAAVSQVAANENNKTLEDDEKNRTLVAPPKSEAGFSSNQDEEHKAQGDSEEAKTETLKGKTYLRQKLNVIV